MADGLKRLDPRDALSRMDLTLPAEPPAGFDPAQSRDRSAFTADYDGVRVVSHVSAEDAMARAERIVRGRAALQPPALYADAALSDFPPKDVDDPNAREKYAEFALLARRWLGQWADTPKRAANVIILQGDVGSGKTRFAFALARAFIDLELGSANFRALGDIVREIRETWRRDSSVTESSVLAKYRAVPLLIIDDVSRHAFVGEPTSHLFEIVSAREANAKPTIITTNEFGESLAALLGAPLLSRAAAYRARLTFPSVDLRLSRAVL